MDPMQPLGRRDLGVVVFMVLAAAVLFTHLELTERLFAYTRQWEALQVDEALPVLVVLATSLSWFAWRRYAEARALLLENRRLAQQYQQAQEADRKALARELHDELGQYLNAIKTDAVSIQEEVSGRHADAVSSIVKHTDHLYAVVRNLIRELRPVALDELGLRAALEHYLDHCQQRMPAVRFSVALEGDLDSLGESLNLAIYRLTQEAVTNVSRHAHANQVSLRVARARPPAGAADVVTFEISDDGRGADPGEAHPGLGLIGMRERVDMLGGQWRVTTGRGQGFSLVACIPMSGQHEANG